MRYFILLFLFVANILVWSVLINGESFSVTFFNIGQGDSIFIQTEQGNQILIDGGPGNTVIEKLGKAMPFWDRTIDLVILTHPESDHLSGLIDVLQKYEVETVLWTGIVRDTNEWREWKKVLDLVDNVVVTGVPMTIDWNGIGYMDVISPKESIEGVLFAGSNETSIVTRLIVREDSVLFTGDIPRKIEHELAMGEYNIDSTILKVAHHGSKTASSSLFINKVSPELAIIQAGEDNKFGHPHAITLETLQKYGIKVLRTDIEGDIKIRFK